jgi:hypothetical protein
MDDDTQELDQAIEIGLGNQRILQLAAAWCQNIGASKGPLGTGLLEEMIGLPITGGSLRCDHDGVCTTSGNSFTYTFTIEDLRAAQPVGQRRRKRDGLTPHRRSTGDRASRSRVSSSRPAPSGAGAQDVRP